MNKEHNVFQSLPSDVKIAVNKSIPRIKVGMHEWKRQGIQERNVIHFFGHSMKDQTVYGVEQREIIVEDTFDVRTDPPERSSER